MAWVSDTMSTLLGLSTSDFTRVMEALHRHARHTLARLSILRGCGISSEDLVHTALLHMVALEERSEWAFDGTLEQRLTYLKRIVTTQAMQQLRTLYQEQKCREELRKVQVIPSGEGERLDAPHERSARSLDFGWEEPASLRDWHHLQSQALEELSALSLSPRRGIDPVAVSLMHVRLWLKWKLRQHHDWSDAVNPQLALCEATETLAPWSQEEGARRFKYGWPPLNELWSELKELSLPSSKGGETQSLCKTVRRCSSRRQSLGRSQWDQWKRRARVKVESVATDFTWSSYWSLFYINRALPSGG